MHRKISYFTTRDAFTNQPSRYAKVIIYNEPVTIRGVKFHMNNVYNVPKENVNNPKLYMQPLSNPRYNVDRAFNIYRRKVGLLLPSQIKHARERLHLSQIDVSVILGMSYATLSKIENNHVIQSVSQDTELRSLLDGLYLARLIKVRLPLIKLKHFRRVHLNNLEDIVKKAL